MVKFTVNGEPLKQWQLQNEGTLDSMTVEVICDDIRERIQPFEQEIRQCGAEVHAELTKAEGSDFNASLSTSQLPSKLRRRLDKHLNSTL